VIRHQRDRRVLDRDLRNSGIRAVHEDLETALTSTGGLELNPLRGRDARGNDGIVPESLAPVSTVLDDVDEPEVHRASVRNGVDEPDPGSWSHWGLDDLFRTARVHYANGKAEHR
jgi:hypothetical protein